MRSSVALLGLAAVCLGCEPPPAVEPEALAIVGSTVEASCAGDARVTREDGVALEVRLPRGLHTVEAEVASCDELALEAVEVRDGAVDGPVVLAHDEALGSTARLRFTLAARAPRALFLIARGGRVGWGGLGRYSRPGPVDPVAFDLPDRPPDSYGARRGSDPPPGPRRLEAHGWASSSGPRPIEIVPALHVAGVVRPGLRTRAPSRIWVHLGGRCARLDARVGLDDDDGGEGRFRVFVDQREVFDSGAMHAEQPARAVRLDLRGARWLALDAAPVEGRGGKALWLEPTLDCE